MSRTITAIYDSRADADRALRLLTAEVSLIHADVYDSTPLSLDALRHLDLTAEERAVCKGKIAPGEYMLLAQLRDGEDTDKMVALLENMPLSSTQPGGDPVLHPVTDADGGGTPALSDEPLSVVREELRVGKGDVVRGGAKVHIGAEQTPVLQEVELFEEFLRADIIPANHRLSDTELEQAGLLSERVFEIAEVREEAVVSKEVFVREQVVVTKTTERRIEQLDGTVRRTEVDVDEPDALRNDER